MQGYQTTLGRGLNQESYRKSGSFQRALAPTALDQTAADGPSEFARAPSDGSEPYQDTDRIAAVRMSGFEAAEAQSVQGTEAAVAAPAVRQGSLLQKGKQRTRRTSVADRLKSVRSLLSTADETGGDDIQEELPAAAVQRNGSMGISNIDEVIAEEPQLAVD